MRMAGLVKRAVALLVAALAGMAPALAETVTISGEVTYRERTVLPENASLRIRLIDLTAPGTPTRVDVRAPIATPGQAPLTFTLNFDDRVLEQAHEHALVAEISSGVELWFRNSAPYALNPVAPAAPIVIVADFVGRVLPRDAAETRPAAAAPAPLLDTRWQAETIGGQPVRPDIESTLTISRDLRAGGHGGCNSYFTQAVVDGDRIVFSAVAATRMVCFSEQAADQEARFFAALAAARFWRLDADGLVLLDEGGGELARLRMVR